MTWPLMSRSTMPPAGPVMGIIESPRRLAMLRRNADNAVDHDGPGATLRIAASGVVWVGLLFGLAWRILTSKHLEVLASRFSSLLQRFFLRSWAA